MWGAGHDAEGSFVRGGESRLNATPTDKDVSGALQCLGKMNGGSAMGGCRYGLEAFDLHPEVRESAPLEPAEIFLRDVCVSQHSTRNGEALAEN